MATPLYNNNTDPIIIPDNLLFYHIPKLDTVSSGKRLHLSMQSPMLFLAKLYVLFLDPVL